MITHEWKGELNEPSRNSTCPSFRGPSAVSNRQSARVGPVLLCQWMGPPANQGGGRQSDLSTFSLDPLNSK